MKKATLVVLLLLSFQCVAETFSYALQSIESEWAAIYYKMPESKQDSAYQKLLSKTSALQKQYPGAAEPIFWEALIKASSADHQGVMTALSLVREARDLLQKAISINPNTMDGSALVTLGTLYYMVPKWPIAFGDNEKAKSLLESALKINPNGIDTNYYYGDFLLSIDRTGDAIKYLENAVNAPVRPEQVFADNQLKTEAQKALAKIKASPRESDKNIYISLNHTATDIR